MADGRVEGPRGREDVEDQLWPRGRNEDEDDHLPNSDGATEELEEGEILQPAPGTPAATGPSPPLQSATSMMGVVDNAQNTDGATQDESPMARKRAREDADETAASGGQAPAAAGDNDETSMDDVPKAWLEGLDLDGYGSNLPNGWDLLTGGGAHFSPAPR